MKTNSALNRPPPQPLEGEIRAYAYHLYEEDGCVPGRELDHWLEAQACLFARIPREETPNRLRRHLAAAGG